MADTPESVPGPAWSGRLWRMELIATLLLGLAAVGAGWAAYQSAIWGSNQTFTLDHANRVRRRASLIQGKAYLLRVVDVGMFGDYLHALSQKNTVLASFLFERFRPPMKVAVRAWLATNPLKDPNAPSTPFAMKEYQLPEDGEVQRLEEEGQRILNDAQRENKIADNYVLVTVPLAIVSLFCGLSTKFYSQGIRTAIVLMACVAFVVATVALVRMPVGS